MPLPKTGTITLSAVNDEFRKPFAGRDVDLDRFCRGGGIVKTIPKNMQVPVTPPIGLDNLHNARYYFMQVSFNVGSETARPPYFTANDGRVTVGVTGVSNNYSVKVGAQTVYLFANGAAQFNNLDTGKYNCVISDIENLTSYYFTVFVGMGSGSFTQYTAGGKYGFYNTYLYGTGDSWVKDAALYNYAFNVPYMIG